MIRRTDLRTVGQIVSAIGLLHIFPSEEKAGEFLVPLLTSVPGCRAASLCFRCLDNPIGSLRGEQCTVCVKEQRQLAETNQYSCRLVEQYKVLAYPLETSVQQYGHLILSVQNLDEYRQYEPFVRNLGNVLAIILENRRQQQELLEGQGLLEQRITERTADLRRANEELRQEIAHRQQIEKALQNNRQLLAETEKIGKVGGWEFDIDTGKQSWTEEIYNIHELDLTYDPTLATGINFYTPASRPIIEQAVQRAIEHGEPFALDLEIITARGNLRSVHAIGKVDQKRRRVYGFFQDITDRKQVEEEKSEIESQNRQLQKAESLGRMAGAIAHTFNNQLGAIIGNLEMAIDDLPEGALLVNRLTTAMKAANKAAEVSSQMMTYLGQSFDKPEPLDLSETCRRGLILLQAAIPRNVVLETELPSPGPVIIANSNHIQQILNNLITNACEAVGTGRKSMHLTVKTISPVDIPAANRFPLDWQPQDLAYACLEVTDRGCGIPKPDIEKIFDPFFTSKFTGRGLGLPVILGILKAHGGAIAVESIPGLGSTFWVFLPLSAEEVTKKPDKSTPVKDLTGGGTILLVEDEEMVRNMAAAMLTRLGFEVLAAKDGVEAVELFRRNQGKIRCVLSDLTMPRLDGWETLTALRQLVPDVPVILASGYDKAQVMAGDHSEWPQVFLYKPYRLKELADAISKALSKK